MASKPACFRPPGWRPKAEAERAYDASRRLFTETRRLYGTARWKRRRAEQLNAEPFCRMCDADGIVTLATVADHVEPHRGDVDRFWTGALQSLCDHHHSAAKQAEERAAAKGGGGVKSP